MPRYYPNILFSDCWASAGNVTFYHRDGLCYWKKKANPQFPGTANQMQQQMVHLRALRAWRLLSEGCREQWNMYAEGVPSHRPPFLNDHSITGHNLFISAYHGFAALGDEHVPIPHAYSPFPIFNCEFDSVATSQMTSNPAINNESMSPNSATQELSSVLTLRMKVRLDNTAPIDRYRFACRLQLTKPSMGCKTGLLRSFVATTNCHSNKDTVEIHIPGYKDIWNLDLSSYQVHMRYFLIDSLTGYRCNFQRTSLLISL